MGAVANDIIYWVFKYNFVLFVNLFYPVYWKFILQAVKKNLITECSFGKTSSWEPNYICFSFTLSIDPGFANIEIITSNNSPTSDIDVAMETSFNLLSHVYSHAMFFF